MLGLTDGSELILGIELGPALLEGTSCADVKSDKKVSNNDNFMAVELGIASRNW